MPGNENASKCAMRRRWDLYLGITIAIAAIAAGCYVSSAYASLWQGGVGSYADSNPIVIPAVPEGSATAAKGWQKYD